MEEQTTQQTTPITQNNQEYIDIIKQLKENSVSKEEYEALQQNNKNLLKALVEGNSDNAPEKEEAPVDIDALRNKLFNTELNNLEYIETALELRDALIEKGEQDPFLPSGSKAYVTAEDIASAERVAAAFKSCVEYAEGDSELFTQELQRITKDVPIPKKKK